MRPVGVKPCSVCPSLVWEEFFEKLKKNNQWHVEVY